MKPKRRMKCELPASSFVSATAEAALVWQGCYLVRQLLMLYKREDVDSFCHNLDQKPPSSESTSTAVRDAHGRMITADNSESMEPIVNSVPAAQKHKITFCKLGQKCKRTDNFQTI